jgi:hypothetical protein
MILDFIQFILLSIISVIILLLIGYCFLKFSFRKILLHNKILSVSVSYFMGVTLFLSVYRILSMALSNAFLAFKITLVLGFLLIFLNFVHNKVWKSSIIVTIKSLNLKKIVVYVICMFLLVFYIFLYWSESNFNVLDPFASVGTLHSMRYVNISKYIIVTNDIPILNQNYGQSLLSTIQLFFLNKGSLLSLIFWLLTSIHFLIIGAYALFRFFNLSSLNSFLGTTIVFLGTSSISFVPTLIVDSGFPFIFNGYSDTIVSIGSFLIFFYWYFDFVRNRFAQTSKKTLFLLFFLFFGWNIFAPQNIIFGVSLLVVAVGQVISNNGIHKKNVSVIFLSCLFFAFLGSNFGGMLANSKLIEQNPINGTMIVMNSEKKMSLSPALPYCIYNGTRWEQSDRTLGQRESIKQSLSSHASSSSLNNYVGLVYRIIWLIESNFWIMLKVLGVPIVGIVGLFYYSRRNKNNLDLRYLFEFSVISILIGIVLTFFLQVSNYKWELSRFLIPGVFLGFVALIISLFNYDFFKVKYRVFTLTAIIILPNFILSILVIYNNLINLHSFNDYLRLLIYF